MNIMQGWSQKKGPLSTLMSEPKLHKIEPFLQTHPTIKMRLYRPTLQY